MTRIHFDASTPVLVDRINGEQTGAFFTITIGSTQLYLSVGQAESMRDQLNTKFSAGVPVGVSPPMASANDSTLAAPAEPAWNRFPEGEPA